MTALVLLFLALACLGYVGIFLWKSPPEWFVRVVIWFWGRP